MRWMLFCVQFQSQKQDVCKRFVCVFACVSTHTVESFLSFFRVLCAVTSLFSLVGSPLSSLFVFVRVFFFGDSAVFCVLFFSFIHTSISCRSLFDIQILFTQIFIQIFLHFSSPCRVGTIRHTSFMLMICVSTIKNVCGFFSLDFFSSSASKRKTLYAK